jgi:hypothetical protein
MKGIDEPTMAPAKEAGSFGRPLPSDLGPINTTSQAAPKSGKGSSPIKKSGTSVIKSNSAKVSPDKVAKTPDKSKVPFRYRWMKKLSPSNGDTSERDKNGADNLQESRGTRARVSANGKSTKKTRGSASTTNFEKLIDFNAAAAKKSAPSGPPKTPRKFLFGIKPTHNKYENTQMKDAANSDDELYKSDEYEDCEDENDEEGMNEETPRSTSEWTPAADEYGLIGPDHPSVPKSLNNMEKARKKTKGDVDPNGRHHGRELVHWHRK